MDNLKTLQDLVEDVLDNSYAARNSDDLLYYYVIKRKSPEALEKGLGDFLLHRSKWGIPNIESVTRARRKICERRPDLRGNDEVEAGRELNEEEFRKYARGAIYD